MKMKKIITIALLTLFIACLAVDAYARAGGGGRSSSSFRSGSSSYGSRGSRSYSAPARPQTPSGNQYQTNPGRQPVNPLASTPQAATGSPFWRGMAGGFIGGMAGSLLFGGHGGYGGGYGGGGGGIGLFDILLIAAIIYFAYRFFIKKKQYNYSDGTNYQGYDYDSRYTVDTAPNTATPITYENELMAGLSQIRQYDPSFDESRFKETILDIFFKVQAAWMNRNLTDVRHLLAPEITANMQSDLEEMKSKGRINRMENIALRDTEITEAWQEQGRDYLTVKILANVLDYITDESGNLLDGSKSEPIKFVEFWTFARPTGSNNWQLSAIQQDN